MWLLDFVETALSLDVESFMFESEGFDDADDSRFLFGYLEKCYAGFLNGHDDFETHERMLAENMKIGNHIATEDLDQLENAIRTLNAELEILELESDKMASLNDRKQLLQTDLKRFENYLQEFESHKSSLSLWQQEKDEDFQRAEVGGKRKRSVKKVKGDASKGMFVSLKHIKTKKEYKQGSMDRDRKDAVDRHFSLHIKRDKADQKSEAIKCLAEEPVLRKRTWEAIKLHV
ncbi:kinetochore protein NDC80 homolog [Ptychodera flava]|uniref:kinetochore protein NDC80 homolog n=1 Tax=Ptychodera flava TaxID=63121 RepID=UPI00396A41D6